MSNTSQEINNNIFIACANLLEQMQEWYEIHERVYYREKSFHVVERDFLV